MRRADTGMPPRRKLSRNWRAPSLCRRDREDGGFDLHLPPWKPIFFFALPHRCALRTLLCAPSSRQAPLSLRRGRSFRNSPSYWPALFILSALAGIPADVIDLFMALLSLRGISPRAYKLKVSNAASPISILTGTSPRSIHVSSCCLQALSSYCGLHQDEGPAHLTNLPDPGKVVSTRVGCGR